jgi:hypothetical protein
MDVLSVMDILPVIGGAARGLPPELERCPAGLNSGELVDDLALLDAAVASVHLVFDGGRLAAATWPASYEMWARRRRLRAEVIMPGWPNPAV